MISKPQTFKKELLYEIIAAEKPCILKIIIKYVEKKSAVLKFNIQVMMQVKDLWEEVIRYDTAHGRPHAHIFIGKKVLIKEINGRPYGEILEEAEKEVTKNIEAIAKMYLMQR